MGHREARRVPLDFNWPVGEVWHGYLYYPETEPPAGDGWQLWETTSEGSPVSPVFASAEELADWCEGNATVFAGMTWTRDQWLRSFLAGTTDMDSLVIVDSKGWRPYGPR